ncbi:MAG: hypothetical protein HY814_10610 [Candidatus Riflebacteria bacterium]|nr:hypothetical protein [Candidatus Riflebacteria bacterium]
MFLRATRWLGLGGLIVAVAAGMALAASEKPEAGEKRARFSRELGQRLAASARLEGDKAVQFVKVWEAGARERHEGRRQFKQAMKALKAASEDSKANVKRPLDDLQKAVLSMLDSQAHTISAVREVLPVADQARMLLAHKGWKLLALPGMKQAVPAIITYFRDDFLNSVTGLSSEARKHLQAAGDEAMKTRVGLVEKRLELLSKLEEAGPDGKETPKLLDGVVSNTEALCQTIVDQISETRKTVPDAELARVLVALKDRVGTLRQKLGFLKGVVKD